MAKLVIVMAIVASFCFVKAVPVPAGDPMNFVSSVVGFDVQKMIDDSVASIQSEDGNPLSSGSMITSKLETVMKDGAPVQEYVTRYVIKQNGEVIEGVL